MTLKRRDSEESREHWDFAERTTRQVQDEIRAWQLRALEQVVCVAPATDIGILEREFELDQEVQGCA